MREKKSFLFVRGEAYGMHAGSNIHAHILLYILVVFAPISPPLYVLYVPKLVQYCYIIQHFHSFSCCQLLAGCVLLYDSLPYRFPLTG